jgi:hypothetical protein
MSLKLVYSMNDSLHGESSGTLHTTNRTNAAFKVKDYMVNKSGNLKFIYGIHKTIPWLFISFYSAQEKGVQ